MNRKYLLSFSTVAINSLYAFLTVAALTIVLKLIGRDVLGEAVIALLYLVPVGWSSSKWGNGAGICAAVTAALAFDFFFIPPFYTFVVGRLEGWLVLGIFLVVSIVVIGRIQTGMTRAFNSEREAIFMYEMSCALAGLRTQEAVIHALATTLQLIFQAQVVEVSVFQGVKTSPILVTVPSNTRGEGIPDRILPILSSPGFVGEIRVWRGNGWLPAEGSRLLSNLTSQASQALERAKLAEAEAMLNTTTNVSVNKS